MAAHLRGLHCGTAIVGALWGNPPSLTAIGDTVNIAARVEPARTAANEKNVVIFGANLAQQCLRDGLLDEIVVHLAPVLLGDGVRLYESVGTEPIYLTRTDIAVTGQVTDLRFRA